MSTLLIVMAMGLMAAGVAGCSLVLDDDEAAPSAAPISQPDSQTVAPPTSPVSTPQPTTPTTDPSLTTVLATPPTDPTPTTPEIDAAEVLQHNPLYGASPLQVAGCSSETTIPLDGVDNVRAYYASVLPCLDEAWKQIGNDATGIAVRSPALEVFGGPSFSPCGDGFEYSFYCPTNETIYMYADELIQPWLEFSTEYSHGLSRLAATHTLAHEYGHHIQQLTGILPAIGPNFSGTESERRLELQASCLANVFLSSQSDAYPIAPDYLDVQDLWRFITRVPNHGSEANQALWTQRGYQAASPGDCDTFGAAAPDVA